MTTFASRYHLAIHQGRGVLRFAATRLPLSEAKSLSRRSLKECIIYSASFDCILMDWAKMSRSRGLLG